MARQALCSLDAQGDQALDLAMGFIRESTEPVETIYEAERMLAGAWASHAQADEHLARLSRRWDVHRMPTVDRNILRLAWWELHTGYAPVRVAITEAIRLAQEFSTADSPRFINGLLDTVSREMPGADSASGQPADEPLDDAPLDDEPDEDVYDDEDED